MLDLSKFIWDNAEEIEKGTEGPSSKGQTDKGAY